RAVSWVRATGRRDQRADLRARPKVRNPGASAEAEDQVGLNMPSRYVERMLISWPYYYDCSTTSIVTRRSLIAFLRGDRHIDRCRTSSDVVHGAVRPSRSAGRFPVSPAPIARRRARSLADRYTRAAAKQRLRRGTGGGPATSAA